MKPHAYARALHIVDWRHGFFELSPMPLLTLFFWYATTDLWVLVAAGKRNSLWFLYRLLAKFDLYGRLPLRSKQPQISCFLPVYGSYDYHKELKSDCRYSAKSRFRWLFTQRWHTTVQVG